jgi:maleylpyruvate isomerase
MKLYDYWRSSAAYRVRIALNLKGVAYDLQEVHLVKDGGAQKTPTYRSLNPQGLVPALQLDDDQVLQQSLAIMEYLDEIIPTPAFLPKDPLARARVRAMAEIIACDIHPINNLRILQYLKRQLGQGEDAINTWYRHWIAEGFRGLEELAARHGGKYLFGDSITLADICLVPQMYNARRYDTDLTPYPKLREVDARCQEHEAIAKASPDRHPAAVQN